MRRIISLFFILLLMGLAFSLVSREPQPDPRLKHSFRRAEQNGWTFVHLEGTPSEIGFQHGYLLAPEVREGEKVTALELTHEWPVVELPVDRRFVHRIPRLVHLHADVRMQDIEPASVAGLQWPRPHRRIPFSQGSGATTR